MFIDVYIYNCDKRKIEHTYKTKYFALQFYIISVYKLHLHK